MREGEGVVIPLKVGDVLLLVVVLVVADVIAASVPAALSLDSAIEISRLLLLFLGVDEHLHAVVVETLGLDHVEHVEFDFESLLDVCHSEVKPLRVSF